MPEWLQPRNNAFQPFFGMALLRSQLLLLGTALALIAIQWLLTGAFSPVSTLVYTFIAGNVVTGLLSAATPLYIRPFPRDWINFIAILIPVALIASIVGGVLDRLILGRSMHSLLNWRSGDIPYAMFISALIGISTYAFASVQKRMEAANTQLAQEVQLGRNQLESHATELQSAFEIQSNLLPRTIPQIPGVEISCAWQPARTVSGDFFDVLRLSDTRIAFCLADVSGKGMSAALITANIQAAFRAFATDEPSPARLCRRLNEALCASLPTGRFVTFVYAILDRKAMTLTYELAGHNPPFLLRGDRDIPLPGSGTVLGLFPGATFADHTQKLQPGDHLILSTDGVTEAFNPAGEEFGDERLLATARGAGTTAHSMRVEIMKAVTSFCEDHFHDDASLMVVHLHA